MTAKHTPGPWTLSQHPRWPFCLTTTAADGTIVAVSDLATVNTGDKTTAEANARAGNAEVIANETLRAAAPDLLAALAKAEAHIVELYRVSAPHANEGNGNRFADADPTVCEIRAAISSATSPVSEG